LLAGLLASTQLVGRPAEYFSAVNEPSSAAADYGAYVAETLERTSRGGVFGAKIQYGQLDGFLAGLRSVPGWHGLSDLALLQTAFPQPSFIWISRCDLVAQAVSWLKADQTGEFYVGDERRTGATPTFEFETIERLVGELAESNERWQEWFTANGIEPLAITYEELTADMIGTSRRVLAFLGVEVTPDVKITASTIRQADAVNEAWIARYHAMDKRQ
jgi:LPS sulfotransferase NodH